MYFFKMPINIKNKVEAKNIKTMIRNKNKTNAKYLYPANTIIKKNKDNWLNKNHDHDYISISNKSQTNTPNEK